MVGDCIVQFITACYPARCSSFAKENVRIFGQYGMQIRSTAYALTQLLALRLWASFPLMDIAPWRKGAMLTAGLFAQWLRIQFIGLRVRDACNPKSGHFVMPFPGQDQRLQC